MANLTHFDAQGQARMVDVSEKASTSRVAIAAGSVRMSPATLELATTGRTTKGDVLNIARLAGIMAAKKTSDLIPLCHPLALGTVGLELKADPALPGIRIEAHVRANGKTGVEMEALTAVSVAALTLYDMLKAAEKAMVIENIHLVMKDGGKSGRFEAP